MDMLSDHRITTIGTQPYRASHERILDEFQSTVFAEG
jgi:hypothetical protein